MAGRAGRPKYDKNGEALLIAKTADEADYLMDSYLLAKPERIWSRLAVEKSCEDMYSQRLPQTLQKLKKAFMNSSAELSMLINMISKLFAI
jgi:replicative superfamily II helicase